MGARTLAVAMGSSLHIGIREEAIKQHIHRIYEKMHVQNRPPDGGVDRYFGR